MADSRRQADRPTPGPTRLIELRVHRGAVIRLAAVAVVLCLISLTLEMIRSGLRVGFRGLASLEGFFDIDREANIPAWFQGGLLILCALLLWTIADDVRARRGTRVLQWRALALTFVYLSADELASLHERADEPLHNLLDTSGVLLWAWVLVAIPLLVVFGLLYLPFLRDLPAPTRRGLLLAGFLYVSGAVLVEMLGSYLFSIGGLDSLPYQLAATGEEALEMAGILVALAVLGTFTPSDPDAARSETPTMVDLTRLSLQPSADGDRSPAAR